MSRSNKDIKTETEKKIQLYLSRHPGSRYTEIRRGMNEIGWKISDRTLAKHLKRMSGQDPETKMEDVSVTKENDRYSLVDKAVRGLSTQLMKLYERSASRSAWYSNQIRSLGRPESMIEIGFNQLATDFLWTLRHALADQDHLEVLVMMHRESVYQLMKDLILALSATAGGFEAIQKVDDEWQRRTQKEQEQRIRQVRSKLRKDLLPSFDAFFESFKKQGSKEHTIDAWLLKVIEEDEGGKARTAFEREFGEKADYWKLLDLKRTIFGKVSP